MNQVIEKMPIQRAAKKMPTKRTLINYLLMKIA